MWTSLCLQNHVSKEFMKFTITAITIQKLKSWKNSKTRVSLLIGVTRKPTLFQMFSLRTHPLPSSLRMEKANKSQLLITSKDLIKWRLLMQVNPYLYARLEEKSATYLPSSAQLMECQPVSDLIHSKWEMSYQVAERIQRRNCMKFRSFQELCLTKNHWVIGVLKLKHSQCIWKPKYCLYQESMLMREELKIVIKTSWEDYQSRKLLIWRRVNGLWFMIRTNISRMLINCTKQCNKEPRP